MNSCTERIAKSCVASKTRRFANHIIDMILFRLLLFPTWFLIGYFIGYFAAILGLSDADSVNWLTDPIVDMSLTIASLFVYYFAFEAIWQRTPAKFITGTKVVNCDGTKPTARTIALRTLARLVPFEPFSFLGKEVYGWHDKWSGTAVVRAKTMKQNLAEPSLQTAQCEKLAGITALSVKEYGKEQLEEEIVVQAEAVLENSVEEKQGVATEQIGAVKIACNEEIGGDAVALGHTTGTDKEQAKWLVLALLAVIFIVIIIVRFSNTPATTRANKIHFVPLQKQRDLSTPSSRLVGHWENVDNNACLYFSPIDPDLKIGTYRNGGKSHGRFGPPFRFKVLFEDPSGTQLVIRPYGQNEVLRNLSVEIKVRLWMSDVTYTLPKHGQSMTQEYTFSGSPTFGVYRYIDNKTGP